MKTVAFVIFLLCVTSSFAQHCNSGPFIHSHNDYEQNQPLIGALHAGAKSIEIDIFLHKNTLMVAHSKSEIRKRNTLENLYILPLKKYLEETEEVPEFYFLIDIKSEAISTLNQIEKTLKEYPGIFSKQGIQVIISGNRPKTEQYLNYDDFIWFDGREPEDTKKQGGHKIAMISQNLYKFTQWRGNGKISVNEKEQLNKFVEECHRSNVPVRLWNTGDTKLMYEFLFSLKVDYINTDNPKTLQSFLNNKKHHKNNE